MDYDCHLRTEPLLLQLRPTPLHLGAELALVEDEVGTGNAAVLRSYDQVWDIVQMLPIHRELPSLDLDGLLAGLPFVDAEVAVLAEVECLLLGRTLLVYERFFPTRHGTLL